MKTLAVILMTLALAACASVEEPARADMTQPASPAASQVAEADEAREAPDPDDPDQIICRIERVTGQLRREQICRTSAEWRAIRESGRDTLHGRQATQYYSAEERPH